MLKKASCSFYVFYSIRTGTVVVCVAGRRGPEPKQIYRGVGVGGGGGREKSKNHDVVRLRKSNHPSYTSLCSNTFGRRTWRLFMFWLLINNIPRWAKWIVFEIELNLLLSCFVLSALYLPLPDSARHHSTSVHKAFPSMVIVGSLLIEDALPLPPFPISVCYLLLSESRIQLSEYSILFFCILQ